MATARSAAEVTPLKGKVLVAIDGASGGRDAIALARILAPASARMVLTNVYGVGADADSDPAQPGRPGGLAGRALHRLARKESAELLVVGSSHRGPTGRTMLGGQTLAALNGSSCAVAIAPRGYGMAEPEVRRVGVGDAGTAESELAVRTARALAERHGAGLEVRGVTRPGPRRGAGDDGRAPRPARCRLARLRPVGPAAQRYDLDAARPPRPLPAAGRPAPMI